MIRTSAYILAGSMLLAAGYATIASAESPVIITRGVASAPAGQDMASKDVATPPASTGKPQYTSKNIHQGDQVTTLRNETSLHASSAAPSAESYPIVAHYPTYTGKSAAHRKTALAPESVTSSAPEHGKHTAHATAAKAKPHNTQTAAGKPKLPPRAV